MTGSRLMCGAIACCLALGALSARADDVDLARNKLLAQRAAEADAYRKLGETIRGLRIDSQTLVRDFVTESDVIRSELDAFLRDVKLGEPHWFADLSCEVVAEVPVQTVVEKLREIYKRYYHGDYITEKKITEISRQVHTDIIRVVGAGAPRADLPPGLPEGVENVLTSVDALPPAAVPDIWEAMGPQARLTAHRAGALVAQRRLLERVGGLRINSSTLVRDFVTEWDEIRTQAEGVLQGAEEVSVYYHDDEPIVEVTYAMPVEAVVRTIQTLHKKRDYGDATVNHDITRIRDEIRGDRILATGQGVPNKKYVQQMPRRTALEMPEWATGQLKGSGTAAVVESTAQGKLKALHAAEQHARMELGQQVGHLPVMGAESVSQFLASEESVLARLDLLVAEALVQDTAWSNGEVRVTVILPGMEVWGVLNDQLQHMGRE